MPKFYLQVASKGRDFQESNAKISRTFDLKGIRLVGRLDLEVLGTFECLL